MIWLCSTLRLILIWRVTVAFELLSPAAFARSDHVDRRASFALTMFVVRVTHRSMRPAGGPIARYAVHDRLCAAYDRR